MWPVSPVGNLATAHQLHLRRFHNSEAAISPQLTPTLNSSRSTTLGPFEGSATKGGSYVVHLNLSYYCSAQASRAPILEEDFFFARRAVMNLTIIVYTGNSLAN